MILLIIFSIIAIYRLSVLFFRKVAKDNKLNGVLMMILGLFPIINFLIALLLFVFNEETSFYQHHNWLYHFNNTSEVHISDFAGFIQFTINIPLGTEKK